VEADQTHVIKDMSSCLHWLQQH